MKLGMFLEFPVIEGGTEKDAFDDSMILIDQAEPVSYTHLTLPTILLV